MSHQPPPDLACNVMISAAGRRVGLITCFQQALADLHCRSTIFASDLSLLTPAMQLAPSHIIVPPYRDPACLDALLAICRQHQIRVIIPTIDPELAFYTQHRDAFRQAGCHVAVSSPETVAIGNDKVQTHQWLLAHGFPTILQMSLPEALQTNALEFPAIMKPRYGSASIGISRAASVQDLAHRAHERDLIVQSIAPGQEYTVDIFIDSAGHCRCAVPRLRIETRGGEVSKGMTVRNPALIELASRIGAALPGAYGILNIQMFYDRTTQRLSIIEINPRFGGGYPLTHRAGAPMARWLLEDILGLPSTATSDTWQNGLIMLRYDEAVYVTHDQAGYPIPE